MAQAHLAQPLEQLQVLFRGSTIFFLAVQIEVFALSKQGRFLQKYQFAAQLMADDSKSFKKVSQKATITQTTLENTIPIAALL
ncbi:hypothetical protein [Nodosilinea sp. P-1105]|uniref:hypothetical protein n=1 Tax=Nodosilinea sp. P-1105 TaxID=2546229 RepID=UPI00146D8734|nr:hypothetical protein [Nodosilinea sp. P-1105]